MPVPAHETGFRRAFAGAAFLLAFGSGLCQAAEGPLWRIEQGEVRVLVPLKPGGAFEAKTSSLGGTLTVGASRPLPVSGEISVDLATIDTGIDLRNRHLREKYLEIAKGKGFDRAVMSEILVSDAQDDAFEGRTVFTGMLLLHGVRREVTGTGVVRRQSPGVRVQATFPLTLTDFGVEPPEYMGVGVANKVIVSVVLTATPARGAGR
jgi:polyisoprenoid-binding protein YceI